jgi:hypothetical protein
MTIYAHFIPKMQTDSEPFFAFGKVLNGELIHWFDKADFNGGEAAGSRCFDSLHVALTV